MPLFNFSGIASGIDTEGLIEATQQARRQARVEPKEEKITDLEGTNTSLEELKTKLAALRTFAQSFGTLGGGITHKLATSTDESIATAVASKTAATGSYTITTTQLAKNATQSLASASRVYTAPTGVINPDINDAAPAADRTVTVDTGLPPNTETVSIVMSSTTTLDQFVTQYNQQATKSTAGLINIGTAAAPNYQVLITSKESGAEKGTIAVNVGLEVSAGLGAFDNNSVSQALDAQFTIDGISGTITRPSNTISNLIDGVSFQLQDAGTTTIQVAVDSDATQKDIEEYVELFNEIAAYINENNLVTREGEDDDAENIFGPLSKTQADDSILSAIRRAMSSSALPNDGVSQYTIFSAMGITTERDGTLKIDSDKILQAINKEPESIAKLFTSLGDTLGKTGGTIDSYTRFNGVLDTTIKGNDTQIKNLQDDIAKAERFIEQETNRMRSRFARLEGIIGQMQSQQQALSGILAGLSTN